MSVFDDYFATVTPEERAEFERIRRIVHATVPSVEEGLSYGMPAYLYKGKAFLSAMATKHHLSLYPFSGKVVTKLAAQLSGYETTSGSIHYSLEQPVPEDLVKEIIAVKLQELEEKYGKH